jgi:hypothetical protein
MDPADYYKSLSQEMDALKGRIRHLIAGGHWPTDGEWKESVLRTVLRRHLPPGTGIGRGFIVNSRAQSSQIDVLLYDTSYPLLHQDGDLVFVIPDAVRGIIEVKSRLRRDNVSDALRKLADNAGLIGTGAKQIFLGLFAFEDGLGPNGRDFLFSELQNSAEGKRRRAINHVCVGPSSFYRFWANGPELHNTMDCWRQYAMIDMARGYFVFNALEASVGDAVRKNLWAWFPRQGKEYDGQAPLKATVS